MRVGPYEVLRKLGEGAYGRVYLARRGDDSGFQAWYALKRIGKKRGRGAEFERYLLQEARLGGMVAHPSVVRVHEVLRLPREWVLVQDFVDGVPLAAAIATRHAAEEPIPRDAALELSAELLEALHSLHTLRDPEGRQRAFVHRDVKPGNIMLADGSGIRLMDFGVARTEEGATLQGELRGTIAWMSPEQARGEPVGPQADQYAAGLVLLELLTLEPPWGNDPAGVLQRVLAADVSHALSRVEDADPVRAIVAKMLAVLPADRFSTCDEAAHALRTLRAQSPTPPQLRGFATAEIARVRAEDADHDEAPSWSASDSDGVGTASARGEAGQDSFASVSGAWDELEDVPDDLELELDPGGGLGLDTQRTLPLPQSGEQRHAMLRALAASAETPAPRPLPTELPEGLDSARTLPLGVRSSVSLPVQRPEPGPQESLAPPKQTRPPRKRASAAPGPRAMTLREQVVASPPLASMIALVLLAFLVGGAQVVYRLVGPERDVAEPEKAEDTIMARASQPFASGAPRDAASTPPPIAEEQPDADGLTASDRAALAAVVPPPATPAAEPEPTPNARREAATPSSYRRIDPEPTGTQPTPKPAREPGAIVEPVRTRSEPTPPPVETTRGREDTGAREGTATREDTATRETTAAREPPTKEPEPTGPALRLLSAREQPLGVPLGLRVRPDNFLATSVVAYYQWRQDGSAGRRRRDLAKNADGSFSLEVPASELREDRLQVWFVAEPGAVTLGGSSAPIEVRLR